MLVIIPAALAAVTVLVAPLRAHEVAGLLTYEPGWTSTRPRSTRKTLNVSRASTTRT